MVNKVPEGWKRRSFGEFCSRLKRKAGNEEPPILSVGKNYGVQLQSERFDRRIASNDTSNYLRVRHDEFVYDPMLLWSGSIARQTTVPEGIVSPAYYTFDIDHTVDKDYFEFVARSPNIIRDYKAISLGTNVRRKKARFEDFLTIEKIFPPLPEQKKIAAILSSVDEAIEATEAVIEQTRTVKKGLLQELLTRGIGHTEFKKTAIGEIPKSWDIKSVAKIASLRNGKSKATRNLAKKPTKDCPFPTYGGNGIAGYTDEALINSPTVVIGRVGEYCGSVHLTTQPAWVSDNAIYIDNHAPSINIDFLAKALLASNIESLRKKTGQPLITQSAIETITLPIPSITEQLAITQRLTQTNIVQKTNEAQRIRLNEIKRGLLQDLLTGKVRVNTLDLPALLNAEAPAEASAE